MTIIVCGLSRVPHLIEERKPSHVVSLLDPLSNFPAHQSVPRERHLQVEIHDISEPIKGLRHVDDHHLSEILDFVGAWPRDAPLLVHCYAGISRSSATAFITACVHNPSVDEEEIAWSLRRASANAAPNRRLVALADAMLERGGRLSRAVQAIGPAAMSWPDIMENTPFELAVAGS